MAEPSPTTPEIRFARVCYAGRPALIAAADTIVAVIYPTDVLWSLAAVDPGAAARLAIDRARLAPEASGYVDAEARRLLMQALDRG